MGEHVDYGKTVPVVMYPDVRVEVGDGSGCISVELLGVSGEDRTVLDPDEARLLRKRLKQAIRVAEGNW